MNSNDLMNALSGLDPKYIDEAAFELKDTPVKKNKVKAFRLKKALYIALPAAAVAFLTITVTLPFIMRLGSSDQASSPASDQAYDAADTAEAYDAEEAAAEEPAPAYEAEEAAEAPAYEAEEAAAEGAAPAYEAEEAADAGSAFSAEEAVGIAPANEAEKAAEDAKDAVAESSYHLDKAEYKEGMITLDITGELPSDIQNVKYSIIRTDEDDSGKPLAEGDMEDIITGYDPLILDLTKLELSKGTYMLTIGTESIEFTV